MRKSKTLYISTILFLGTMVGLVTGCAKTGMTSSVTNPSICYVSILNLTAYSDTTNVYFNGGVFPESFPSGSFTTHYVSIPSGNYGVKFESANASDSLFSEIPSSNLDSLGAYTFIIYNDTSSTSYKSVMITDNFSNITNNNSYYRFFNMSPDMPAVDLYINNVLVQPGRTIADNVQDTTLNNFIVTPNGFTTVQVFQAGTKIPIANSLTGTLNTGQAYTFFLEELHSSSGITYSLSSLAATL